MGVGDGRRQAAERRTRQWSTSCQSPPVAVTALMSCFRESSPSLLFVHISLILTWSTNSQVKNTLSKLGVDPQFIPPGTVRPLRDFFPRKVA